VPSLNGHSLPLKGPPMTLRVLVHYLAAGVILTVYGGHV
jgi:hypothetical protein